MPAPSSPDIRLDHRLLIEARRLRVGYGGRAILPALDITLKRGEFWALLGRNGSGKTTLLRTLLGLLPRISGEIDRPSATRVGYVPQRSDLDANVPMRVVDMVRDGLDSGWSFLRPWHRRALAGRAERAMADTDVTSLSARQFSTLSEGQKQRVLIARVLASEPDLFVLDEPTSAMDLEAERDTFALIGRLMRQRQLGVIVVSHHIPVVAGRASHVCMTARDAVVAGPVETALESPAFAARYGRIFGGETQVACSDLHPIVEIDATGAAA